VTPDTDRWSRKYVERSPATTPKVSARPLPDSGAHSAEQAWTTKRQKHLSLPTYATTAAQNNEVESLRPHGNKHVKSRDDFGISKEAHQEMEETISRAFGSVLDPAHQRRKWNCHSCKTVFVRDQTVYPHPSAKTDAALEDLLYCPRCFASGFVELIKRSCI
jgi:hypothetical protein